MLVIRLKAIMAVLLFWGIGAGVFLFSLQSLIEYFEFNNVIIYSWMDCFAFLFSFFVFSISIAPGYVVIYGEQMAMGKLKAFYKIIFIYFVISLVIPILFSFFYLKKIEYKGYVQCNGIPSGWMPGMATKYAISEELCLQKSR